MSPLGAVKGDEQGRKKPSVSRSDTQYIYCLSDILSPITDLQLSKRATKLQNFCRYSSRLHTRARGKGRASAELLTSSAHSRVHGVGRRPDKHPQLAGSCSSSKAASGRLLPLATGRFGLVAVASERPLLADMGRSQSAVRDFTKPSFVTVCQHHAELMTANRFFMIGTC